jgi:hypothetical protein
LKTTTSSAPSPLKSPTTIWSLGWNCQEPGTRSTPLNVCVKPAPVAWNNWIDVPWWRSTSLRPLPK